MEARLKEDILREAKHYGGAIMVIHETDDKHIFDAWEFVTPDVIQTPLEVFKSLEAEGLPVKYARVPITDGKAPKSSDFDTMAINIASAAKDTAFVFNCQVILNLLSNMLYFLRPCSFWVGLFVFVFSPYPFLTAVIDITDGQGQDNHWYRHSLPCETSN